jgi:hypothetical protein
MAMSGYFKTILVIVALAASVFLGGLIQSEANSIFSFLLPTQNLNLDQNNRSNKALANTYSTSPPIDYQIYGDSFTLGTSGQRYQINTIRLWTSYGFESTATSRDMTTLPSNILSAVNLWAGPDNGQPINGQVNNQIVSLQPQSVTSKRVWYANGHNFLNTNDQKWRAVWQFDFTVNWSVQGGQIYHYFLDGLFINASGFYQNIPLHVANPALSGVSSRNTDATYLIFDIGTKTITSVQHNLDANIEINPNTGNGSYMLLLLDN